jgi:hypothetical protein
VVWIFAAVVLWLAVAVPGFRKVLLIGVGLLAALAFIAFLVIEVKTSLEQKGTSKNSTPYAAPSSNSQPPKAPKEIPIEQLRIGNFRGVSNPVQYFRARIYNDSPTDTLASLQYRLTIDDCSSVAMPESKDSRRCTRVHDETQWLNYPEVPPGQARDVSIEVRGSGVSVLGSPKIEVAPITARAKN